MSQFLDDFRKATGAGNDIEVRARAGTAPDMLLDTEIATLMGANVNDPYDDISAELRTACARSTLRATTTRTSMNGSLLDDRVFYLVHRDDARRYFASLRLRAEESSPLWNWLNKAGAISLMEVDKADFQQTCMDFWKRNPTRKIRGESGAVAECGDLYIAPYGIKHLTAWAKEIAPPAARRGGRPRKTE